MNEVLFMESVTVVDVVIRAFIAIGAIILCIGTLIDTIKEKIRDKKEQDRWKRFLQS